MDLLLYNFVIFIGILRLLYKTVRVFLQLFCKLLTYNLNTASYTTFNQEAYMATGRRRGRAIFYIAFILILILVLVVVVARFNPLAKQGENQVDSQRLPLHYKRPKDTVDIVMTTQDVRRGQILDEELTCPCSNPSRQILPMRYSSTKMEDLDRIAGKI